MASVGCDQPYRIMCLLCAELRWARCGRASSRACGPCGGRSRARVGILAGSGMILGREGVFLTLTAPSWREHFLPNGDPCKCTGGGCADLAEWNGSLGKRWNEFVKALRRHLMTDDLQYFKAVEPQRRFALHLHVLVRRDDGPLSISKVELRKLAMHYGFGHEVDVQGLLPGHASYVAKYASKAADDRKDVPWRGLRRFERVDMTTGEIRKGTAVAYRPTYRTWSASGRWGERMAEIRAAQGHHEAVMAALVPWSCRAPWPAEADVCPRRPVHARDGAVERQSIATRLG